MNLDAYDVATEAAVESSRDETVVYASPVSGEPLLLPGDSGTSLPPSAPPFSPGRANVVLVALAVAAFLFVTNEIAPMGLLPSMAVDLGRSEAQLGMAVTVFAVAVMLATLPLALLTTRMVRRWVLVGALVIFTAGTFLAAIADTYAALLFSRALTASATRCSGPSSCPPRPACSRSPGVAGRWRDSCWAPHRPAWWACPRRPTWHSRPTGTCHSGS